MQQQQASMDMDEVGVGSPVYNLGMQQDQVQQQAPIDVDDVALYPQDDMGRSITVSYITEDKEGVRKFFSKFCTKTCCECSLEVPHWGAANEYPQHIFCAKIRKKYQQHNYVIEK